MQRSKPVQSAPELCALLEQYYAESEQGNSVFLANLIDPDPGALVVGTDPNEWWVGGEHIVRIWSAAWIQRGGLPVRGSNPSAFREGSVGWLADQAVFRLPNGTELPFRLTAVFRQDGDGWKMVQAHFSFGVPD